ncbi:MAG: hypothetical protein AAFU38_08695 [Bacteroidota bacterium]
MQLRSLSLPEKLQRDAERGFVDVMLPHRLSVDSARLAVETTTTASLARETERGDPAQRDATDFAVRMSSWKSGALLLAAQLNTLASALVGAKERLLDCAQGVLRYDMTGCAPGFPPDFYTDVPLSERSISHASASLGTRVVFAVRRDRWNPVPLSRWYMAFLDVSRGNRVCWLDRRMVNLSETNYREPSCDWRGLCDPLEVDADTLFECQVRADGRVPPSCPVSCGPRCFGPLCYKHELDSYELRTAAIEVDFEGKLLSAPSPAALAKSDFLASKGLATPRHSQKIFNMIIGEKN